MLYQRGNSLSLTSPTRDAVHQRAWPASTQLGLLVTAKSNRFTHRRDRAGLHPPLLGSPVTEQGAGQQSPNPAMAATAGCQPLLGVCVQKKLTSQNTSLPSPALCYNCRKLQQLLLSPSPAFNISCFLHMYYHLLKHAEVVHFF